MRIVVLVNPEINIDEYFINLLMGEWRRQRHEVILWRGYADPMPEADVIFLHVDLTIVPDAYSDAVKSHPNVINRPVTNIGKDKISGFLIDREARYEGPVIVKTTRNYFGLREHAYETASETGGLTSPGAMPWLTDYPVFKHKEEVPEKVWTQPGLVVEKFLPEISRDGYFCLRVWSFLGDRERLTVAYSRKPVIKSGDYFGKTFLDTSDVPEELRARREKMGFDYGKFDFTVHKGEAILFDANKTIGASPQLAQEKGFNDRVDWFSRGLFSITSKKN